MSNALDRRWFKSTAVKRFNFGTSDVESLERLANEPCYVCGGAPARRFLPADARDSIARVADLRPVCSLCYHVAESRPWAFVVSLLRRISERFEEHPAVKDVPLTERNGAYRGSFKRWVAADRANRDGIDETLWTETRRMPCAACRIPDAGGVLKWFCDRPFSESNVAPYCATCSWVRAKDESHPKFVERARNAANKWPDPRTHHPRLQETCDFEDARKTRIAFAWDRNDAGGVCVACCRKAWRPAELRDKTERLRDGRKPPGFEPNDPFAPRRCAGCRRYRAPSNFCAGSVRCKRCERGNAPTDPRPGRPSVRPRKSNRKVLVQCAWCWGWLSFELFDKDGGGVCPACRNVHARGGSIVRRDGRLRPAHLRYVIEEDDPEGTEIDAARCDACEKVIDLATFGPPEDTRCKACRGVFAVDPPEGDRQQRRRKGEGTARACWGIYCGPRPGDRNFRPVPLPAEAFDEGAYYCRRCDRDTLAIMETRRREVENKLV